MFVLLLMSPKLLVILCRIVPWIKSIYFYMNKGQQWTIFRPSSCMCFKKLLQSSKSYLQYINKMSCMFYWWELHVSNKTLNISKKRKLKLLPVKTFQEIKTYSLSILHCCIIHTTIMQTFTCYCVNNLNIPLTY